MDFKKNIEDRTSSGFGCDWDMIEVSKKFCSDVNSFIGGHG